MLSHFSSDKDKILHECGLLQDSERFHTPRFAQPHWPSLAVRPVVLSLVTPHVGHKLLFFYLTLILQISAQLQLFFMGAFPVPLAWSNP